MRFNLQGSLCFIRLIMKKTLTIAIVLLTYIAASAQGVDDASLYSQTFYQGTAKALGMGNALGAVGGDMTAININPASMGIYRSNEITMSVNLLDNYHKSNYYGTEKEGASPFPMSASSASKNAATTVGYVSPNSASASPAPTTSTCSPMPKASTPAAR